MAGTFESRFNHLFKTNQELMPDDLAKQHGINSIFVMGLADALEGLSLDKLEEHVLAIYKKILSESGFLALQIGQMESSDDPWKKFVEKTRVSNQQLYDNAYFQVQTVIDDDQQFGIDINRCLMFEILEKNGCPELGPVLCKYDYILADNVSKWVSFERNKTIADGHARCDFRYHKKELAFSDETLLKRASLIFRYLDGYAKPVDKLDLKGLSLSEQEIDDWIDAISFIQSRPKIEMNSELNDKVFIGLEHQWQVRELWKQLMNKNSPLSERIKTLHAMPANLDREEVLTLAKLTEDHEENQDLKWHVTKLLQRYFTKIPEIPEIIEKLLVDKNQPFSVREMCLWTMLMKRGMDLVPLLRDIAENKEEDPFMRGRVIDALAEFTSRLPKVVERYDDFITLPVPIQRSVIDFIGKHGTKNDLLIEIATKSGNQDITRICYRLLGQLGFEEGIIILIDAVNDNKSCDILRQAAIEALGKQEINKDVLDPVLAVLLSPSESTFLKVEALKTVEKLVNHPMFKDVRYKLAETTVKPGDWIAKLGLEAILSR
jgi:HEAT repeat protein